MMRLTEKPTTTENRAAFARQVYKDLSWPATTGPNPNCCTPSDPRHCPLRAMLERD